MRSNLQSGHAVVGGGRNGEGWKFHGRDAALTPNQSPGTMSYPSFLNGERHDKD